MLRTLTASAFAAVVGIAVTAADPPKPMPAKLEGSYTIVSGESDGKPLPADHFKGALTVFTADKVVGTDKDKKQLFAASYTLDAAKTPMKITMKVVPPTEAKPGGPAAVDSPGLVELDGDTMKLIYSLPGADAPTEFKTKANQHMFVLKRVTVEEKK